MLSAENFKDNDMAEYDKLEIAKMNPPNVSGTLADLTIRNWAWFYFDKSEKVFFNDIECIMIETKSKNMQSQIVGGEATTDGDTHILYFADKTVDLDQNKVTVFPTDTSEHTFEIKRSKNGRKERSITSDKFTNKGDLVVKQSRIQDAYLK